MTKVIRFTKLRFYMMAVSAVVIIAGIAATAGQGGFNLSIDFQAGLNQRVQVAPVAFSVSYTGNDDATLNVENNTAVVEIRGEEGVETYQFPFNQHETLRNLTGALDGIDGVSTTLNADPT